MRRAERIRRKIAQSGYDRNTKMNYDYGRKPNVLDAVMVVIGHIALVVIVYSAIHGFSK